MKKGGPFPCLACILPELDETDTLVIVSWCDSYQKRKGLCEFQQTGESASLSADRRVGQPLGPRETVSKHAVLLLSR